MTWEIGLAATKCLRRKKLEKMSMSSQRKRKEECNERRPGNAYTKSNRRKGGFDRDRI